LPLVLAALQLDEEDPTATQTAVLCVALPEVPVTLML
jgi:hypothetical protein